MTTPVAQLGLVLDRTDPERLAELWVTRVGDGPCSEHGSTWFLMEDPEGNDLCVCDGGQSG